VIIATRDLEELIMSLEQQRIERLLRRDQAKHQLAIEQVEPVRFYVRLRDAIPLNRPIMERWMPLFLPGLPPVSVMNLHSIKKTSSGQDLVIFCGYTREEWTPETARTKGVGGSEEAVIWLAQLLADKGWNVTVYNNCGDKEQEFGKVTYRPFRTWNYRDKQDVVIVWRVPRYCDYEINARKIFVDLHDVIPTDEFTEKRLSRISKIFVKSKFQRDLFPQIADEKFVIVPNGIDPTIFEQSLERDPYLIINTSGPDRGIAALTEMFRDIKALVPQAKLKWAYGWSTFDAAFEGNLKVAEWKENLRKKMQEYGVEELGRISHGEVAKLYLQANLWAYPSGFGEIDCISLSKAMAGGAIPITTDLAALGEKQGHGGYFVHSDLTAETWVKSYRHDFSAVDAAQIKALTEKIIELLTTPPSEAEREEMRKWATETFAWQKVVNKWHEVLQSS
jgi:glycosyltransferase involved in cell wall biosynthesis